MPLGLMRWMIRRTCLLLFPAFPLVVRHQLAFLSVYQSIIWGQEFFCCVLSTYRDCWFSWDTNPVVWNNFLEHLELCLEKDKEMVRIYRRARRFHLSCWESPDL